MSANDPRPSDAVPQSVGKGAALMLAFKLVERGIGFVSVLILARLLTPADFGLVAMATSVVALIELMGAFGFDTALIQRPDAQRQHFDTAWTFQVLFGVASAALLVGLAIPAGDFYRDSRVTLMMPALAVGAMVQGFENIGPVMFRKSLDFRSEFIFLLSKRMVAFVVTILMALIFRNFWALVAGTVTGRVATTLLSYSMHTYRPRFSLAAKSDLLHFSKWLFLTNLLQFAHQNADKFILGRTIGATLVGQYNVANEIASLPSTALIAPINRAVYPVYARLAKDISALREQFLSVYGQIAMLSFPTSVGIACSAELLVEILLGPQWAGAVPLLKIFILVGLLSALLSNLFAVIIAMGHPQANTLISGGALLVYIPAIIWASLRYGAVGAAWVHLTMSVLMLIPLHIVFFRLTGLDPKLYLSRLWRPFVGSLVMTVSMRLAVGNTALQDWPVFAQLLMVCLTGAITFSLSVYGIWVLSGKPPKSTETVIIEKIWPIMAKLRNHAKK